MSRHTGRQSSGTATRQPHEHRGTRGQQGRLCGVACDPTVRRGPSGATCVPGRQKVCPTGNTGALVCALERTHCLPCGGTTRSDGDRGRRIFSRQWPPLTPRCTSRKPTDCPTGPTARPPQCRPDNHRPVSQWTPPCGLTPEVHGPCLGPAGPCYHRARSRLSCRGCFSHQALWGWHLPSPQNQPRTRASAPLEGVRVKAFAKKRSWGETAGTVWHGHGRPASLGHAQGQPALQTSEGRV